MTTYWPYPTIVAHRGGGSLAPENTLAAIDLGAHYGQKMIEVDVKLSADGQLFLLHDDDLDRTSNGSGPADRLDWPSLARLDAGAWFSPDFCGEPLALLSQVAQRCQQLSMAINIEIKPSPGREAETGRAVALAARQLWHNASPAPLLSSFSRLALDAARQAVPELPRGLLLEHWSDDILAVARQLECYSLHLDHDQLSEDRVGQILQAGLYCLAWTVNSPYRARTLFSWGVNSLCTDRIDLIDADFASH